MATIEFQIEKNSPIPLIKQIQEQIKLSVAMGMLKKGDILPSIREVEKQTGINRGQIHRAYIALRQAGLVSTTLGRRLAVTVSAASPELINKKCSKMASEAIKRIRMMGVSPVAFARYLGRSAQEDERRHPFIAYVDVDKEMALMRAEQVSRMWQALIVGLTVDELKVTLAQGSGVRKVLVNHLNRDRIRGIPRGSKVEVIPIKIRYTKQTIDKLGKIKPGSSILIVLPNHSAPVARFIVEQLRKLTRCKEISWVNTKEVTDFYRLVKQSKYERILVSPGARSKVPADLHKDRRIHLLQMELDKEDLEVARIRAGVIL